jgi:hypothetical protein
VNFVPGKHARMASKRTVMGKLTPRVRGAKVVQSVPSVSTAASHRILHELLDSLKETTGYRDSQRLGEIFREAGYADVSPIPNPSPVSGIIRRDHCLGLCSQYALGERRYLRNRPRSIDKRGF